MGGCAKVAIVFGVLGILFVIIFFAMCGTAVKQAADQHVSQQADFAAQTALEVTAIQLYNDYHANEVAADSKYKDKKLAVTGTVNEIRVDIGGDPVVELNSGKPFQTVDAYFPKSAADNLTNLKKGDTATFTCRGGGMIIGDPQLRNCSRTS
jgi:hypothetical protein